MTERFKPSGKYERLEAQGTEHKHYKQLSTKLIADIFLFYKRKLSALELQEILARGLKEKEIEFQPIHKSIKTIRRYIERIKKGAQIDHMGTMQDLDQMIIEKKQAEGGLAEKEKRERLEHKKENVSREFGAGIESTMHRVEHTLGIGAENWNRDLIYRQIIKPMVEDKDPFTIDEQLFKETGKRVQLFPRKVWSVLTINGIAGACRAMCPRLMDKSRPEGALKARYEDKWTEFHGHSWEAPRTYLKRWEWELFGQNLIDANPEKIPNSKYTVGQILNLIARVQIAAGFREKKEVLALTNDKLMMGEKESDWQITSWSCKKSETWRDIPLYLFQGLALKEWGTGQVKSPSLYQWMLDQKERIEKEEAKDKQDSTKDTRIFRLGSEKDYILKKGAVRNPTEIRLDKDYSTYSQAIAKARTRNGKPIFEGAEKISGHSFRRTHATWLRMCGCTLDEIAGHYPEATLGIGWKDVNVLKVHYIGIDSKETQKIRKKGTNFVVDPELETKFEKEAGKLVEIKEELKQAKEITEVKGIAEEGD